VLPRPGHGFKENVLKACRERHRNRLASDARGGAIGNGTPVLSNHITLMVQHPLPPREFKVETSRGIAVPADVPMKGGRLKSIMSARVTYYYVGTHSRHY
jgi:hypothetical protein